MVASADQLATSAGLAIFAKAQWEDVDVTAFTGAGVMVIALMLAGLVIVRYVQGEREPEVVNVIAPPGAADPEPVADEPTDPAEPAT